jgi:hypothetical protein
MEFAAHGMDCHRSYCCAFNVNACRLLHLDTTRSHTFFVMDVKTAICILQDGRSGNAPYLSAEGCEAWAVVLAAVRTGKLAVDTWGVVRTAMAERARWSLLRAAWTATVAASVFGLRGYCEC